MRLGLRIGTRFDGFQIHRTFVFSQVSPSRIERDSIQPRIKVALMLECSKVHKSANERILHDVFGQKGTTDIIPDGTVEPILVTTNQAFITALVAGQRRFNQLSVAIERFFSGGGWHGFASLD